MHGRIESSIAQHQSAGIELNSSCSGQARSNRPGTGPGYENTEPGCIHAVFRVPSINIIRPVRSADTKSRKVV